MSATLNTLFALGLMSVAGLTIPTMASAGDGRADRLEDRIDAAENVRDAATDRGRRDRAEDRIDLAEDKADAAGIDRYNAIDRHERRTWRRILRND